MIRRLWKEEAGAIVSAEIMLIASILVIGVIVGLKSVRDSVVTELADVAQALANVDQSYSYSATSGHHAFTAGGFFADLPDFCDQAVANQAIQESKCVTICNSALHPTGAGADGN
jgi:Flp pilus assembly pilin Flp